MSPSLITHKNRLRRLRVLQILYTSRPEELGVGIILHFLKKDTDLTPNKTNVTQSLDYLEQRGFCVITGKINDMWQAKITVQGIEYLEGDDPGMDGISHPDEFMS